MKVKVYSMPYGLMAVWDKIDDAMRYFVHLKVADYGADGSANKPSEIKTIIDIKLVEVDRSQLYYSFDKLAYLSDTVNHDNSYGRGGSSRTNYR